MSGITKLTALTITTRDDLEYTAGGPDENGKFSGWIIFPGGRPLLSSQAIYDSQKLAIDSMLAIKNILLKEFDPEEFMNTVFSI